MAEETKYKIGFRLYAEVELTAEQLKTVAKGDSSYIEYLIEVGQVSLGGGDSYIPIPWLQEDVELPAELRDEVSHLAKFQDITVDA